MATRDDKIVVLNAEKYPSNSKKRKLDAEGKGERPKPKAVAVAKRVKKPFLKRFADTFLEGGTGADVVTYIIHDVVIPAAKSTMADLVEGAIDMVLFGEEGGRRRGHRAVRDGGRSYLSYSDMYSGGSRRDGREGRTSIRRPRDVDPARASLNRRGVESIILGSRQEAEVVLGEMIEISSEYGTVAMSDLYDLVGLSSDFTDEKWGWIDLHEQRCTAVRVRDGWALELPRPTVID